MKQCRFIHNVPVIFLLFCASLSVFIWYLLTVSQTYLYLRRRPGSASRPGDLQRRFPQGFRVPDRPSPGRTGSRMDRTGKRQVPPVSRFLLQRPPQKCFRAGCAPAPECLQNLLPPDSTGSGYFHPPPQIRPCAGIPECTLHSLRSIRSSRKQLLSYS